MLVLGAVPVTVSCAPEPVPQPVDPVGRIIAEDAARAAAAQQQENTYPDLRDVPPRPDRAYTPEQRQEIQRGLAADLDYARRTSELVRTTDGASPPPPPESPPVIAAADASATAPVLRKAPSKVLLVERRDTSGDLSTFLDDVVGVEPEVDMAVEPSLVPSPRNAPTERLPLAGRVSGDAVVADPAAEIPTEDTGFFSAMSGVLGGPAEEAVTTTPPDAPDAAPDPTAPVPEAITDLAPGTQAVSVPVDGGLEIGRLWLFPLDAGPDLPTDRAMAPMLAAVGTEGALENRRLAVVGRSADPVQASRRAEAMAGELVEAGVPRDRIGTRVDGSTPGEVVSVQVVPPGDG
jgi:hypothetical protein